MLTNVSRSKGNQAVKFGQLLECNMRNYFSLKKSYTKCGRSAQFVYIVLQVEGYRNILKLGCIPIAFTLNKAFLKNKKRSGTTLHASFSARFLKKNIGLFMFFYLTKFHCVVAFTSWDNGHYVDYNCLRTRLRRHKFWH